MKTANTIRLAVERALKSMVPASECLNNFEGTDSSARLHPALLVKENTHRARDLARTAWQSE
jgi:hypothetical protein